MQRRPDSGSCAFTIGSFTIGSFVTVVAVIDWPWSFTINGLPSVDLEVWVLSTVLLPTAAAAAFNLATDESQRRQLLNREHSGGVLI